MSIGPDIGGDIADAPSHGELIHDIVSLDIVLDFLEVASSATSRWATFRSTSWSKP